MDPEQYYQQQKIQEKMQEKLGVMQQGNIGLALGPSLAQLKEQELYRQFLQQNQTVWTSTQPTFPTVENVQKRIDAVNEQIKGASMLLKTLEEIHAILVKHPDLERLVSTMARLGAL